MNATPLTDVDPLLVLHEALLATGRERELGARLRALGAALATLGNGTATIALRDASLDAVRAVRATPDAEPELWDASTREGRGVAPDGFAGAPPIRGAVWRRWLRLLRARRLRAGDADGGALYELDLTEPWAREEFGVGLCGLTPVGMAGVAPAPRDGEPTGLLIAPLADADGVVLATLVVEARDAWPLPRAVVRAVEVIGQQVVQQVAESRLATLAGERAERLQRLQEAGAALARSLDEQEIVRELARQVARLVPADGIVVAHPDLERGTVHTALRLVRGLSRPRAEQPLGTGPIAEAARSGRTIRVDEYDAAREPLAAADDVVGDASPASSVLAAPMRVGTQLVGVVAVHAAVPAAYRAEDEELLRAVAGQAGTAIANARLFADSEAQRRQTEALAEVARAVGASLRFGEVLRVILRHTSALLRAGGACVALRRDDYLQVAAGVGAASLLSGVHVPVASSIMGRAVREGRHYISNDVPGDDGYYRPLQRIAALEKAVIVPLVGADGPIGVIAALNRDADFTDADARVLLRLADHVAVAIVNARQFEEVTNASSAWKVAFDAIAAGLVVLDEEARVSRCNQRAAELTGASSPKELIGRDFRAALGMSAYTDGDAVDRALSRGETARGTVHATLDDGRARRIELVAAPHPDGGAVVTFDDVTEQAERAEALARSEARYERLLESATDAIFTADADGRIASVNHALERATGRPRAELVGLPCTSLAREDDRDGVRAMIAATLGGERVRRELYFTDVNGATRVGSVVTAPIAEDGVVVGVLGVVRDVTDERRLAEQLVQREKLASVGRLVRGIAHELNNPLASVLALADLMLDEGVPPDADDVRDAALAIRAEARRASTIIGRLHAFARQRPAERAATDVNRVVLDVLDLRRHALRMQNVDIVVDLDYELPVTWADPGRLQQVFVQMLAAAERALHDLPDGRRLTITTHRTGERIEIGFRDNGPTKARSVVPLLDAPDGAAEDDEAGAGLALASEMVREHGGSVRAEMSEHGATLIVELPFVPPPALGAEAL